MNNPKGRERLVDGLKIRQRSYGEKWNCSLLFKSSTYITDEEILTKLWTCGVQATSPIKRRKWVGTDIYEGTRIVQVKFNEQVSSFPYSTKFETLRETEHVCLIHYNQLPWFQNPQLRAKVRRLLLSHMKERCGEQLDLTFVETCFISSLQKSLLVQCLVWSRHLVV